MKWRVSAGAPILAVTMVVSSFGGTALAYQRPGRTELVSVATGGALGAGWSTDPNISPEGRFVVFGSNSTNLVPNDTNGFADIFIHDRTSRVTERVSVASDGTQANAASAQGITNYAPVVTPGGRYVVFVSDASNLVAGDTNGVNDVFLHDRLTRKTERISIGPSGEGNAGSWSPSVSSDGRYVAFASGANNFVAGDTNLATDVFVRDRATGTIERASVSSTGGQGTGINPNSTIPYISADGRFLTFASNASNLIPADDNTFADVFVRDRLTRTTERVSRSFEGGAPNEVSHPGGISDDGRYVVFDSQATNLVPADTNGPGASFSGSDVFVFDRQIGRTERVSVRGDGAEASSGVSYDTSISPDGRFIGFASESPNLVAGDTNNQWDAFVHDRLTGDLERVSLDSAGNQANGQTRDVGLSTNGRYVVFSSPAGNLVPGDSNGARDVFVRDLGPEMGVGDMTATSSSTFQGPKVTGSGWTSFSGTRSTEASDPPADGASGAGESGAELIGASISHRPETGDLLVKLGLASLPNVNPVCGKGVLQCPPSGATHPGVVYGLQFSLAGTTYQARAIPFSTGSVPPATAYFALYRCLETCVEIQRVTGGIGTAGVDVRISVPVAALGASEGSLTGVNAFTGFGSSAAGPTTELDDVDLPAGALTQPIVRLGVAPPGASYGQVAFSTAATLTNGVFTGSLSAPGGTYRLWANACFAQACSGISVLVSG